jgi:uracil-DNA glycosylase family 4
VNRWEELAAGCRACTACPELARSRRNVVVGVAPAALPIPAGLLPAGLLPAATRPSLVLVGEAPGAAEDATGLPFVGRAGQLLDDLLAAAGLNRSELAVLNTVKCRPPGNRAPARAELAACRGWLQAQLGVLGPALVVSLGLTATRWFLGPRTTLAAVRGAVHEAGGYRVLPTYHPSAALRFGPHGAPRALLGADLAAAAGMLR